MRPSKLSISLLILISHFFNVSQSQPYFEYCHPHDKKVLLRIKHHLGNPPSLASWDLNNNCSGPWDQWIGVEWNGQGHATTFTLSGDYIHIIPPFLDRLPALSELYFVNMPNLTEPLPPYIGNLSQLSTLYINNVNISGPYPDSLGHLTSLNRLVISSTNLRTIPKFVSNLTGLTSLDLSNIKLTGPIPSTLGRLTNLGFLTLYGNKLSGSIPNFLGKRLVNLLSLDFHNNNISGTIPSSLGRLPKLQYLILSNNRLSGSVPMSIGLGNIIMLRLENNRLTGDASTLIDKNENAVIWVDISNNLFQFDLTNVELAPRFNTLNISHNRIYGRLPKLFYRLRDVLGTYVDITYNELCGPIPNGRHLKQVNPNVFAHNKCLCGGPLSPCK